MRFEFSGYAGCGCWWAASRFYLLFKMTQWARTRLSVRGAPLSDFFSSQSSIFFFSEAWLCAGCVHKVGRMFTWLGGSRPEQMKARGPHNLWSQEQLFQAALEKEGKIFKVKFSPQSWKGWMNPSVNFPCIETAVRSDQQVSGRSSQPVRQDGWLERVWSEGWNIYFKQNGSEDCRHSRK